MYMNRTVTNSCICGILAMLIAWGCGRSETMDPEIEKLGRATGPVEAPRAAMPPPVDTRKPEGALHRGEVLETIQVPNYTYVFIKTADAGTRWTAIPSNSEIRVGQNVEIVESVVMKDFTSRSLGRTFSTIVFGVLNPAGEEEGGSDKEEEGAQEDALPAKVDLSKLPPGHPPIQQERNASER